MVAPILERSSAACRKEEIEDFRRATKNPCNADAVERKGRPTERIFSGKAAAGSLSQYAAMVSAPKKSRLADNSPKKAEYPKHLCKMLCTEGVPLAKASEVMRVDARLIPEAAKVVAGK